MQALASTGQATVAEACEVSESTVSRLKDEQLKTLATVLAALGLKVVPESMRCYQETEIEAIFQLAKGRMQQLETAQQLTWE